VLPRVAVCCSVLQCVAVPCSRLLTVCETHVYCHTCLIRMCDMTHSYVIQMCVAVFYCALQCVAVRCAFVYHTCLCQDTVKSRTDSLRLIQRVSHKSGFRV